MTGRQVVFIVVGATLASVAAVLALRLLGYGSTPMIVGGVAGGVAGAVAASSVSKSRRV